MSILNKIKKAVNQEPPQAQLLNGIFYEQMFKHSKGFKGFKRFRVTFHGYEPTEKGMEDFLKAGGDLEYANILLQGRWLNSIEFVDIYVNGHLIGSLPDWTLNEEQKRIIHEKLYKGNVTGVHLMVDDPTYIFFQFK